MDLIASQTDYSIPAILPPTRIAFISALEGHREEIESITRRTFKYGTTDRHQLDVFYPPAAVADSKAPVVFFFYGGGYASGDRVFPPPADLVHRNVGAFYAKHGIITVIADYRLAPQAKFPDPVQDAHDAIAWIIANTDEVNNGSEVGLDVDKIFLIGHSAGAAIITSLFLLPQILPISSVIRNHVRGLVLIGGYFHSRSVPTLDILKDYYGPESDDLRNKEALGLLESAPDEVVHNIPEVFILKAEKEPRELWEAVSDFTALLSAKLKKPIGEEVIKGHNHVSPALAPSSGEGEEFAESIVAWIKARV